MGEKSDSLSVPSVKSVVNSSFDYVPRLDGIRGLAICCVMAMHQNPWQGRFPGGWVGVDLFFVLSGYLITSILTREYDSSGRISFGKFYRRRVLRLYPALVVCVLLGGLITAAGLCDSEMRSYFKPAVLALTYLTGIIPLAPSSGGPGDVLLHQTWSLAVEEQFYLIWPLVLALVVLKRTPRGRLIVSLGFMAGFSLMRILLWRLGVPWREIGSFSFGRDDMLMCGAVLSFTGDFTDNTDKEFFIRAIRVIRGFLPFLLWPSLAFLVYVLLTSPQGPWIICGLPAVGIAGASLIAAAIGLGGGILAGLLDWKLLQWIGKRSYGLYLYHLPILIAVNKTSIGQDPIASALAGFGLAFLFTWFSYKYIESPFLKMRKR